MVMTHEDERRSLTSIPYGQGEIKIIVAKKYCHLGDHYHKVKTESFRLINGIASITINGKERNMKLGREYIIKPNDRHLISVANGTVISCLCSHHYDKTDDYEY